MNFKRKKSRFFVVEARRLIPLVFLLVLLLGLTVYENFFRVEPAVTPVQQEEEGVMFTTTDFGTLAEPTNFTLVGDYDEWARASQELGVELPDYPFNAAEEVAVFAVNSEIQDMEVVPVMDEVEVRVLVEPREEFYHVVTVDRDEVEHEETVWKFMDEEGNLLSRITPLWEELEEEGEEEEEAEEEEEDEAEEIDK